MLKRKIYDNLLDWFNNKNKKALVIRGLRQVGKTYIAMFFAKEHYKNVVYILSKNEGGDSMIDIYRQRIQGDFKMYPYRTAMLCGIFFSVDIPHDEWSWLMEKLVGCVTHVYDTSTKTFIPVSERKAHGDNHVVFESSNGYCYMISDSKIYIGTGVEVRYW